MSTLDKYEYKVRSEEIRTLIAKGEYAEAAEIADVIDWRRVKSVMMLCTISDLYKINRRFEDSKELLMLAHERHPGGRTIIYSLCELAIKMGEFVQAIEYYKAFVQIAPKDSGRYILQYKLYCAQEVTLEERIDVLEEMKKRDYREKWAYELAYLYHRVGLATKCVEECDELVLWFGEGKYVTKAMELKMLHQPLTPEQQAKYEGRFGEYLEEEGGHYHGGLAQARDEDNPIDLSSAPTVEISDGELDDIQVQTMDVGQYNTINLQKELADSMKELWDHKPHVHQEPIATEEFFSDDTDGMSDQVYEVESEEYYLEEQEGESGEEPIQESQFQDTEYIEETLEEQFDVPETYESQGMEEANQAITQSIVAPLLGYTQEITGVMEELQMQEETRMAEEAETMQEEIPEEMQEVVLEEIQEEIQNPEKIDPIMEEVQQTEEAEETEPVEEEVEQLKEEKPVVKELKQVPPPNQSIIKPQLTKEEIPLPEFKKPVFKMPPGMEKIIAMEYDGQMSLVVPDSEQVEKQITGQMNIEEILTEWEKVKKENEEKRAEGVRQLVLQHTGNILIDFDEAAKAGLLEQLVDSTGLPKEENLKQEELPLTEIQQESDKELESEVNLESEADLYEEEGTEETQEFETEEDLQLEELAIEEEAVSDTELEMEDLVEDTTQLSQEEDVEDSMEALPESDQEEPESIKEEPFVKDSTPEVEDLNQNNTEKSKDVQEEIPKSQEEQNPETTIRQLTKEEKELFGAFIQNRRAKEQIIAAVDAISLAAYTGNVIITGEEGMNTLTLAKNMMREVQLTDGNFSGKIAKITGSSLNRRDIPATISKIVNGALIIENAGAMEQETVTKLEKALQQDSQGIIVVMEGTKKSIQKLLDASPGLANSFSARVDIEALDNDSLVSFGRKYAREREYSIDEMGLLALHTKISDNQTSDHSVTILEVKDMVDLAITRANRKSVGHLFDILLAKRYDKDDMIILREWDFD